VEENAMKNTLFAAALAASLLPFVGEEAHAGPVTYSTGASQLCFGASGCGTNTQTIGSGADRVVVSFVPIITGNITASPTSFTSFGNITVACFGGGTSCSTQSLSGLNLYLSISQTGPSAGAMTMAGGAFSGSIGGNSGFGFVQWPTPNAVSIGNVSYQLFSPTVFLNVPSSSSTGTSSIGITGIVTDTTPEVSEPATLGLFGLGMIGLAALRRRKQA
jgi:hypothetical protein